MPAKIEPDAKAMRRFHDAIKQLQRMSGRNFEKVIKSEVGIVLSQTVRSMKKATAASIEKNHKGQPGAFYGIEYSGPVSRAGKQYTAAEIARAKRRAAEARTRGKNGRALYYLPGSVNSNRYPDWLWQQINQFRNQSLPKKKKARGLAARMFVHIADQLGIAVQVPAYARQAEHYKKGAMAQAISTRERGAGKSYELGFINSLTHTNRWTRAAVSFRGALNRRANFLSQSIKLEAKGVIKNVLDRYPGLGSVS
jgi:hypothetical protein